MKQGVIVQTEAIRPCLIIEDVVKDIFTLSSKAEPGIFSDAFQLEDNGRPIQSLHFRIKVQEE